METIGIKDFIEKATKLYGPKARYWKFICPKCRTIQTAADLMEVGVSKEDVQSRIGFSCIGRFDSSKGCNWTLGGLFQIHNLEIKDETGKLHPHFELVDAGESE